MAVILGAGAFIALNFFGWMFISDAMEKIDRQVQVQRKKLKVLNKSKLQEGEARAKEDWIVKNVKTFDSEETRETHLDRVVTGELKNGLDVEITKNAPGKTTASEFFIKSSYKATATGPWNDVMEFIYRLQQPTALRFVPHIALLPKKSEVDDSQQYVEATLDIEQWWAKPDNVTVENSEADVEQPAADTVNPPATDKTQPAASPDAAKPETPPPAGETPPPAPVPVPAPAPAPVPPPN
jgi:hypothetical protein